MLQTILNNLKKEKYPSRIILGGPQISYTKTNLEKYYPQVDVFIRGYVDPTFNSGPNYLNVLQQLIQYKYRGKIALQTRIEMIKPEFLDLIVQLNKTAMVVLEFGLQTIHPSEQKFIDRPSNIKKIQRILNEIYERSIACEVSLIFGLPGQTIDSFEKSIDVVTWNTFI
ncbi:unnamed protein product [Adineta steineri]|uniref:Radical SAM core domain-containing protein n=1 Tax=Adineta steineri TaxID=433720 RepID=A0A813YNI3_9BILA|nr:unnamed protein product [Adineta steineri]CAF4138123.1 unnamed protein product [Adineta steineri]